MPGYHTLRERLAIDGAADLVVRRLRDRQQFSDPLGEAERLGISSAAWPLFGLAWPAGLQLAACMAARPLVPHERILEVGCGLALASLVAHRRGGDVTASDCHPLAGAFLRRNARLNGLPPLAYRHGNWSTAAGAVALAGRPEVEGGFDLIIGSDVLYERDEPGHLGAFVLRHALPRAEVLIVDPNRGNRAAFTRRMEAGGFTLVQTLLEGARLLHYRRAA
jgi:predicted nicotinamide N-methyase